jgi:tetratricopeptide (TPR) repeat protein/streptogramin lyase
VSDQQRRFALLIASDYYTDKKLTQLKAPIVDAARLGELLKDQSIGGGYEVKTLTNTESHLIRREIERFFRKAEKNDLLLLYFAGHGHKSIEDGLLYLATPDSDLEYLDSTTIPAKFINSQIQRSKSSKIVLILDCCYSGAFARDMIARAEDKTLNVKDEFRESGCVVLTSGTAMQFSWEGNLLKKEEQGSTADESSSFYTNLIMKGIEFGEADLNGDGVIACGELNDYIKTKMKEGSHPQKPEIYMLKGDLTIAHNKKIVEKATASSSINSWNQAQKERLQHIQKLLQNGHIYEFNNLRKNDNQPIYLPNIDLTGKDLQGIDLHEAILPEAILKNTMMKGANLTGAKLTKADMTKVDLRSATLYGSILKEAKLIRADLRGAELKGMLDFSEADLSHADLRGVDLEGVVNFEGAILFDVNFTGSSIDKVLLNLKNADLKDVKGLKNQTEPSNKYSDALKQFSQNISDLFNKYNVSVDNKKIVEDEIKQLVKDVESIQSFEDIGESQKSNLQNKIESLIQSIIDILPFEIHTQITNSFTVLSPFNELLDKSKNMRISQMVEDEIERRNILDKNLNNSSFDTSFHTEEATSLYEKGFDLYNQGKYQESIEHFEKVLKIAPDNESARYNRFLALERLSEEKPSYDSNTSFYSEGATSLIGKGVALDNQGKYQEAIEWYDKALRIDPNNVSALYGKGLALYNLGKSQEALEWYDKALRIDPNYLYALNNKGLILNSLHKSQEAIEYLDKALRLHPNDVDALNNKGVSHHNLGRYQEAIEYYDKVLRVDPNYTLAQDNKKLALECLSKEKTSSDYDTKSKDPINKYSFIKSWGSDGSGDGEFDGPLGITIDSIGYVYVTDSGNHRIQKFDSNGTFITKWGKHIDLEDLDIDPDSTGRFERLRNSFSRSFSYGKFNGPALITIISEVNGHVYVYIVDSGNHRIQKFDSTGIFQTKWGSEGEEDGEFDGPLGITVDSIGYVYVTDSGNHRIQKFDSNGNFITQWGSEGTVDGEFTSPGGIAVDSIGYVYVADSGNDRIQKFDSNGNFITQWGSEGTGDGKLNGPTDISIDSKGYVYVADSDNNQIQVFAPAT